MTGVVVACGSIFMVRAAFLALVARFTNVIHTRIGKTETRASLTRALLVAFFASFSTMHFNQMDAIKMWHLPHADLTWTRFVAGRS
jgi:NO-binding membrane sensor protein with MHYT domain